jgi:hypothetical protein
MAFSIQPGWGLPPATTVFSPRPLCWPNASLAGFATSTTSDSPLTSKPEDSIFRPRGSYPLETSKNPPRRLFSGGPRKEYLPLLEQAVRSFGGNDICIAAYLRSPAGSYLARL